MLDYTLHILYYFLMINKSKIVKILRKHSVKRAGLFGSFARGEESEESDIDIVVEFEGRKSLLDLVSLKLELEQVLHKEVDITTYNALHPLLKEQILKEQIPLI